MIREILSIENEPLLYIGIEKALNTWYPALGIDVRSSCTPYEKDDSKVASVEQIAKSFECEYKYDPSLCR